MTSGQGRCHDVMMLWLPESCWLDCLLFDSSYLFGCLLDWLVGVGGCWLIIIGWVGRCLLAWLVCECWIGWLLIPCLIDSWLGWMFLVGCLLDWPVGACWVVVISWVGPCMLAWLVCGCWLGWLHIGCWLMSCFLEIISGRYVIFCQWQFPLFARGLWVCEVWQKWLSLCSFSRSFGFL